PKNGRAIAREIAQRLEQLDPEGKADYQRNLADFESRVEAKEKSWAQSIAPLRGMHVATYHKSWTYVSAWLGLVEVGYVEPKPGIPPDPGHLARLIGHMKATQARML